MTKLKTRFAPSPTGNLHIGHAYSAILAYDWAKQNNAEFILRIEDIDTTRCRQTYIDDIMRDLEWLGIEYDQIYQQSSRSEIYAEYIDKLQQKNLLYPCFATRTQIKQTPNIKTGFDGFIYPKIWRYKNHTEIQAQINKGDDFVLRLKIDEAEKYLTQNHFSDTIRGKIAIQSQQCGDVVIKRKEIATSYHLSVVVDDYLQGITNIIRGYDIFYQTHIHHILQAVFGFNHPTYTHHNIITNDQTGQKLSKSTMTEQDKLYSLKYIRENSLVSANELKQILLDLN